MNTNYMLLHLFVDNDLFSSWYYGSNRGKNTYFPLSPSYVYVQVILRHPFVTLTYITNNHVYAQWEIW